MKIQVRSAIAGALAGAVALTGAGLLAGAPAEAAAVAPRIIGGEKVDSNPWVVQLGIFLDSAHTKGSGCTSEAINDSWLITAKHCVTKPDKSTYISEDLFAVYTNNTADIKNRAKRIAVDKVVTWSSGDVALIHVSSATKLTAFAQIAAEYRPNSGDTGVVQGYGFRKQNPAEQADWLYRANVSVIGANTDLSGGPAIKVGGVNGISNFGDSGGPLTVNGKNDQIVGVSSSGADNPTNDIHSTATYANITGTEVRNWIRSTTGS